MASSHPKSLPPLILACHQSSASKLTDLKNRRKLGISRRAAAAAALATAFMATEAVLSPGIASCFQLQFTAPDQTPEEADAGIKVHVQELLQLKSLIDSQLWRQVQTELRESSSYLKQDLYTLIQAQPGNQRPQLRKLYSDLFNNVTRLDYAARSKDTDIVQECYQNITTILEAILARMHG